MISVLAIDPGVTTGMVEVSASGEYIHGQTTTDWKDILGIMQSLMPTFVVIEDFIGAGPRTREAILVLKTIGKVLGAGYILNIPVATQAPQERTPFIKEAKLLVPGGTVIHIIDAYAHALAWLAKVEEQSVASE